MNVIAALKLYISKTNTLDPPMPWGDDENIGLNYIRVTCTLLIVGFTIIYKLGIFSTVVSANLGTLSAILGTPLAINFSIQLSGRSKWA